MCDYFEYSFDMFTWNNNKALINCIMLYYVQICHARFKFPSATAITIGLISLVIELFIWLSRFVPWYYLARIRWGGGGGDLVIIST